MELIKPFVKYSKLYRRSKDDGARQLIYNSWCNEIEKTCSASPRQSLRGNAHCNFCYTINEQEQQFCTQCFFPLFGDEELATYCMLSVCYYETICESSSHRTVYRQRLKMTWYEHERSGKVYEVIHPKCYQCKRANQNVNAKFTYFNDNMFCSTCMFPLFVISIYD